ncbi:MAG: portal protein, partial [Waterburya sp.]
VKGQITSDLILPCDFVVNYWTKTLEESERKSQMIYLSEREVEERKRLKIYLDLDLPSPPTVITNGENGPVDETLPYCFVEMHSFYDIDDDGLAEPYVITFERTSGKVVRITPRYEPKDVVVVDKKIVQYKPIEYFTKFGFIPNPEGGFYDIGFGHLLGPLNEAVNTILNQLIDAGTLSNLQAGFIGKGLRVKMADEPFRPGEWRAVNAMGDDIRKQLVPLPVKEPSAVLFQLLGMLINSGKELASVAEIFVGKMPGQNTPATTTMATIEQGMKVFTAIYKRLYRAMTKEFKKVFLLNSKYLNFNEYVAVLDETVDPKDFDNSSYDICPGADPVVASQQEKLAKAMALAELIPLGVDPTQVLMRILEAQEQPNWEKLIPGMEQTGQPQIPQKPDPVQLEMQAKQQADAAQFQLKAQEMAFKSELSARDQMFKQQMEAASQRQEANHKQIMNRLEQQSALAKQKIFMAKERRSMEKQNESKRMEKSGNN